MSSAVDIPALKGSATKAGDTASKRAATSKEQTKGTLPRPPAIDTQAKPAAARTATTFSGSDRYSTNSNDMSDFSHQMSPQMSSVTSEARQRHNNELLRTPPAKGRLVARHHSDALAGPAQDGQGSGIEEMRPPRLDVSVMHTGIAPSRHRMTGLGSVVDAYSTTSRGHFMTEDQEFASLGLGLIGERTPPHLAMSFDRSPQSFFATTPQRQIRDLGEGPALRPMSTVHGTARPSGGTPSNFWDMLQTPSAYTGVHGLQSPARAGAAAVDMQAQYALNGSGSTTNAADVPSAQTTGADDDQMRNSRDVAQKLSFTTPLSARNKGSRRTLAQQPTIPEEGEQSDDNGQAPAQAPMSTGRSKRKRRAPRRPGDDSDAESVSGGHSGPGATTEGSPKRQQGGARRGKGVQGATSKTSKREADSSSSSSDAKEGLGEKLVVETGTASSALWAIPNGITSPQMAAFSPGWPRLGLDSATSFAGFGGLTEPHGAMPAMPGTPDRAGETDHVQRLASHMFSPNMGGRTAVASTPSYGTYVPGLSPAGHMAATSSSQFFMPTYGQFTAYPQAFMGMPGGAPTYGGIPPMDAGMMKGMPNGAMMYPQMFPNMQPQAVFGHRSPDQVAQNSTATAAAPSQITRNMPGARAANSQSANRPLAQQHPHRSPDNPTPGSTRTYHQSQNPSPNVKTPMSQPGSGRKSGCTTEGAKQLKQGLGRLFDAYDFGQDGTIAEADLLYVTPTPPLPYTIMRCHALPYTAILWHPYPPASTS